MCPKRSPPIATTRGRLPTAAWSLAAVCGHDWNNTSVLVLHTIGRKSGETKKFPLIYGRDGNNYLIVASKGGAPDHPGWYKNLLAHPDVKILNPDFHFPTGLPI